MEEVVSQAAQEIGVPQLSCYTSFGLLNISITFSNAHLVLLCYIFRFSNGFKHVKISKMPIQGQFFLLRVWGLHNSLHSIELSLPSSEPPTFTILTVKLVIRTSLGLHTSVVNPATMDLLHGLMARKRLSTLQSRWFGESCETMQMIVIFV